MGADIHVHIFGKQEDGSYKELRLYNENGEDITYRANYNDRDYELFGKLAGVRAEEASFTQLRGIPSWYPKEAAEKLRENGYYSFTWYDLVELQHIARHKEAKATWYSAETEKYKKSNIIKPWLRSVEFVADVYGYWLADPGDVIVFIYFDC